MDRNKFAQPFECWTIVADGRHNAFTALEYWRDEFWLVYLSARTHFGSQHSELVLSRSADARLWQPVAHWKAAEYELRDPQLAVVENRLAVYALCNRSFDPQPYQTICACSLDGKSWPEFKPVLPPGWLIGKPHSPDGKNWYAPAHHLALKVVQLLHSTNGFDWQFHSQITAAPGADEAALAFNPAGNLLAVIRLEPSPSILGSQQNATLVACAEPPYQAWNICCLSHAIRLDGPALFYAAGIYAVGRSQPYQDRLFNRLGSIFSCKRTSLYRLGDASLIHQADFPSAGDTAYAGIVIHDSRAWISYYTSDPVQDRSWIAGMLRPTSIQMVCIHQDDLASLTIVKDTL